MTLDWLDRQGIRYENKNMQRFRITGGQSYNPFDANGPNNRDGLNKELGHVQLALRLAVEQGVVDVDAIQLHQRRKRETIAQWLHHFKPSPGGDDESHTTSNKRDDRA